MSSYKITPYTYEQARRLGVIVKPSRDPKKKIDVFAPDGRLIASVGAIGYNDYPTWAAKKGAAYAEERRRLYKIRHNRTRGVIGSPSYWADVLLW